VWNREGLTGPGLNIGLIDISGSEDVATLTGPGPNIGLIDIPGLEDVGSLKAQI
jgi:hypothetical protein